MKLSWRLNLGLQVLLFSGFVLIYMLGPGPRRDSSALPGAGERTAPSSHQNVPMPGSSVDEVVSLGSGRGSHRIGIAHLNQDREISGYFLGRGEPTDRMVQAVRRVLRSYEPEVLAKTEVVWIVLTPDYRLNGRELVSTGGGAPHGMITLNTSVSGDVRAVASHLHHELYWRFEKRVAPALKSGWPNAEYHGDYHSSRQIFGDVPRCYVSAYGASHPVADRAEIFRAMVRFSHGLRLSGDECLADKVALLKKNIEQHLPEILHAVNN